MKQSIAVRSALESSGLDCGPISVYDKMRGLGLEPVLVSCAGADLLRHELRSGRATDVLLHEVSPMSGCRAVTRVLIHHTRWAPGCVATKWRPEHEQRRALLDAAVAIARTSPRHVVRGDLFDTLDAVIEAAAPHGTVIVFHSAVIAYLREPARRRFAERMRRLVDVGTVRWVSNEGDRVLPEITSTARGEGRPSERFVLGLDGRAVARTHGHGASLTWLR